MPEPIRGNILVLDDDPTFRSLVAQLLKSRGFAVIESSSPDEATALFCARDTVLAVVDYRLPQMDGMSWITNLRESGRNTPIIFCSAIPCDNATFNWLRNILKVALILKKPIIPESFVEQVESLLPGYEKVYTQEGISAGIEYGELPDSSATSEMVAELNKLKKKIEIEKAIEGARAEYLVELDGQWRTLTELIDIHNNDKTRLDVLYEARHIAHRIRGTAGSVGLGNVSIIAGKLEEFLLGIDGKEDTQQEILWSEIIRILALGHDAIAKAHKDHSSDSPGVDKHTALIVSASPDVLEAARHPAVTDVARIAMSDSPLGVANQFAKKRINAVFLEMTANRETSFQRAADIRQLPGNAAIPLGVIADSTAPLNAVEELYVGATVSVTHPVSGLSMAESLNTMFNVAMPGRPRVLAIDDDEVLCRFVANVLETEHIEAKTSSNPLSALEMIDGFQPDLILLDVMMPALTGFEVCRRIRENNAWQGIPVIFLTSKTSAEARSAAFAVGANDFITKPVLAAELIKRVNTQLSESSLKRQARARDPETGVMNGDAVVAQAREMLDCMDSNAPPLALALMSVDDFDHLTFVQGHFAAKQVTKALGELLQLRFRCQDLRGRWSDNGYLIVVDGYDRNVVARALEMLQADFAKYNFSGAFRFKSSFSAGVSDSHSDGGNLEEMIKSAHFRMKSSMRERTGVISSAG